MVGAAIKGVLLGPAQFQAGDDMGDLQAAGHQDSGASGSEELPLDLGPEPLPALAFRLAFLSALASALAWARSDSSGAIMRGTFDLMAFSSSSDWTNFFIHSHSRANPSLRPVLGLVPKSLSSLAVSARVENTSPFWRSRKVLGDVFPLISSSTAAASSRVAGDPPPTLTTWPTTSAVRAAAMISTTSST